MLQLPMQWAIDANALRVPWIYQSFPCPGKGAQWFIAKFINITWIFDAKIILFNFFFSGYMGGLFAVNSAKIYLKPQKKSNGKKPTTSGVPRRSPIQVLTRLNPA